MQLELDELWSFVRCKANKRWIWLALCKQTRQVAGATTPDVAGATTPDVVACVVGGRGVATCRRLWRNIPEVYKQGIVFSDFWEAYELVLPDEQHQAVGKDSGLSAHVERFNNTIRQRTGPEGAVLSRTTTGSLCQKDLVLLQVRLHAPDFLHLFLVRYNLDIAGSLR